MDGKILAKRPYRDQKGWAVCHEINRLRGQLPKRANRELIRPIREPMRPIREALGSTSEVRPAAKSLPTTLVGNHLPSPF